MTTLLLSACFALTTPCTAPPVPAQDTIDAGAAVSAARAAQARFERRRIRYLPISIDGFGGTCDETVGRICVTWDEGEWYPVPEHDEIVRARDRLLSELDSLQTLAPASDWILGQRVWYRVEGGTPEAALRVARSCGAMDAWWCDALTGFSLQSLGRYQDALASFERALGAMDEERALEWRLPRRAIDSGARDQLDELENPARRDAWLDRLWMLADPLWLAPGNDRLTEHYARWTVSELRSGARNPFRLSWGDDLEQLTVRNGWEMGWERRPRRGFVPTDDAVGHQHPEGRDYMPPGRALERPEEATEEDLTADRSRPRSLYAPAYAPVLLPMESQLAVFPRGDRTVVVATASLPADTTFHAEHAHPRPWMEVGGDVGRPDRRGLFALDPASGRLLSRRVDDGTEGALLLEIPTGPSVVSVESWSPERRRAGRMRIGVPERRALEDLATLSDILLLGPGGAVEPERLEEVVARALPGRTIRPGQPLAIAWEVAGLGFRPETLVFKLSVERTDRGVFDRLGGFLGLTDRPRPLGIEWTEPARGVPGTAFHHLSLDLPELDEGRYEIRLTLRTEGRSDVSVAAPFEVRSRS